MANVENLLKVRAAIVAEDVAKFDMSQWDFHNPHNRDGCGTAGCIAGFTNLLFEIPVPSGRLSRINERVTEGAARPLGLDCNTANKLFMPQAYGYAKLEEITRADAIAAIDNVILYGGPRWQQVLDTRPHDVNRPPPVGAALPASITAALTNPGEEGPVMDADAGEKARDEQQMIEQMEESGG